MVLWLSDPAKNTGQSSLTLINIHRVNDNQRKGKRWIIMMLSLSEAVSLYHWYLKDMNQRSRKKQEWQSLGSDIRRQLTWFACKARVSEFLHADMVTQQYTAFSELIFPIFADPQQIMLVHTYMSKNTRLARNGTKNASCTDFLSVLKLLCPSSGKILEKTGRDYIS